MDVLHHQLEPVESACLWHLHVAHEALRKILDDYAVAAGEEGKHVFDEVPLPVVQRRPVLHVVAQVDLLHRPDAALLFLVFAPDVMVLDWEEDVAERILLLQWLVLGVRPLSRLVCWQHLGASHNWFYGELLRLGSIGDSAIGRCAGDLRLHILLTRTLRGRW
ncbi:ribonucleoside-diphosphate reductase small chain, putative [Leishmania tarentolae]|uniref:Ribonucleoside-diphosphate reductase small chain, putative n=1 Tax=Leishmania tarentolae TaxID=5689 RepID=A0A640KQV6_LEITA|nr:ribonucleoside-diphosphate reductase small chain, putative [Leishmania tarentolae]